MSPPKRVSICYKSGGDIRIMCLIPADDAATNSFSRGSSGGIRKWESTAVVVFRVSSLGEIIKDDESPAVSSFAEAYGMCGPFEKIDEYGALFGAVLLDRLYLFVSEEISPVLSLPFGKWVHKVAKAKFVPLVLQHVPPPQISVKDCQRLSRLLETQFSHEGFYFSDDVDLRLPYPFSPKEGSVPDRDWDWSKMLRTPFANAGAKSACSTLLRGFVGSQDVPLKSGSVLHMAMIGRQNNRNPGPRFFGRGLNSRNGAGNDLVYELVLWRDGAEGGHQPTVLFCRHTFLRGTIPINWKSKIKAGIGEAEMIFGGEEEVLAGSVEYLQRSIDVLHQRIICEGVTATPAPAIRCINLLRMNHGHEDTLSSYYTKAVRRADPLLQKKGQKVELLHLDWLATVKDASLDTAVETLWSYGMPFLIGGETPLASCGALDPSYGCQWLYSQQRFLRVNCADSLDRTNLGCFFSCLQCSLEMAKLLGLSSADFGQSAATLDVPDGSFARASSAVFSANFDAAVTEGLREPLLHKLHETTKPDKCPKELLAALGEMFVANGDTIAMMYTNSAALHTNAIRSLVGMKSAQIGAVVSAQRRFENIFEDKKKNRILETILGRNRDLHFPSLASPFSVCPVPYELWSCAIVVKDVPRNMQEAGIDEAVRHCWDMDVKDSYIQRYPNADLIAGADLMFKVFVGPLLHPREEQSTLPGFVVDGAPELSPTTSAMASPIDEEEDGFIDVVELNANEMAVVIFDPDLCKKVDIVRELLHVGSVTVLAQSGSLQLPFVAYEYPVASQHDVSEGGKPKLGFFRKTAQKMSSGIKSIVRKL